MKKNIKLLLLAILVLSITTACSKDKNIDTTPPETPVEPIETPVEEPETPEEGPVVDDTNGIASDKCEDGISKVIVSKVDKNLEIVEIYNQGSIPVNISGWVLVSENGGESFIFPADTYIEPSQVIKVASASTAEVMDFKFAEKNVWHDKEEDPAVLKNLMNVAVSRSDKEIEVQCVGVLPLEDVALAVIDGEWGNDEKTAKIRLENAGYNFEAVMAETKRVIAVMEDALKPRPTQDGENPDEENPGNTGNSGNTGNTGNTGGTDNSGNTGSPNNPSNPSNPNNPSNPSNPTTPIKDTEAPVIALKGEVSIVLKYGETFVDPGVEVYDNQSGKITPTIVITKDGAIVSTIDTKKTGSYVITYDAEDKAGNKALPMQRFITVGEQPLKIASIAEIKTDYSIAHGSALDLPNTVKVTLNNGKEESALIEWDSQIDTNVSGSYSVKGTIKISDIAGVEDNDRSVVVKVVVRARVETTQLPESRMVIGTKTLNDVYLKKEAGRAIVSLEYILDENSFISEDGKVDLDAYGSQDNSGKAYYSVGIVSPSPLATHVKWVERSGSGDLTEEKLVAVETINSNKGISFDVVVAKEVDSLRQYSKNTNNWVPAETESTVYTLEWYEGDPNNGGFITASDNFIIKIEDNSTLSDDVDYEKIKSDWRKTRATNSWWNSLPNAEMSFPLSRAGYYNLFTISIENEGLEPGFYKVFYYDIDKNLVAIENEIMSPINPPLDGLKSNITNPVKNEFWHSNILVVGDSQPLPDANIVGAYYPFRITFDESNLADKEYLIYYYGTNGELLSETGTIVENEIFGVEKKESFFDKTNKTMEWFEYVENNHLYNFENIPSVYTIGAYQPFFVTIGDYGSKLTSATVHYYDETGNMLLETFLIADAPIPVFGTIEEINIIMSSPKTEEWYSFIQVVGEEDSLPHAIGAYNLFRLESDKETLGPLDYKVYYYTPERERIELSGKLEEPYVLWGDQDTMDSADYNNRWWPGLVEVDSLDSPEAHWSVIGGYRWFKVKEEYSSYPHKYYFKAYYYDADKERHLVEGVLDYAIETGDRSQSTIDNVNKNSAWWDSVPIISGEGDAFAWYYMDAYNLFRLDTDTFSNYHDYKAYYYDNNKDLQLVSGVLTDPMAIHATEEELLNTFKDEEWFNSLPVVAEKGTKEHSWITQGAYKFFRLATDTVEEGHYLAYYYTDDKMLSWVSGEFDTIPVYEGSNEEMELTPKISSWWDSIQILDGDYSVETVGRFKWFRLASDNLSFENYHDYKAYYYDQDNNLQIVDGVLADEIQINGTVDEIYSTKFTEEWWNSIPTVVRGSKEHSWITMGAYSWFKIADEVEDFAPGQYKAYYYTDFKMVNSVFGDSFDTSFEEGDGTIEDINSTVHNYEWWSSLPVYTGAGYDYAGVGQYRWFRISSDDEYINSQGPEFYKAYYYYMNEDEIATLVAKEGILVDNIIIHGTQEEMNNTVNDLNWWNTIEEVSNSERTWITIGAYKWFKITEDLASLPEGQFIAYYYTSSKHLIKIHDYIHTELVLNEPEEVFVSNLSNNITEEEWNSFLSVSLGSEALRSYESTWQSIGAYKWFVVEEDQFLMDESDIYMAHYYDKNKNEHIIHWDRQTGENLGAFSDEIEFFSVQLSRDVSLDSY